MAWKCHASHALPSSVGGLSGPELTPKSSVNGVHQSIDPVGYTHLIGLDPCLWDRFLYQQGLGTPSLLRSSTRYRCLAYTGLQTLSYFFASRYKRLLLHFDYHTLPS